MGDITDTDNAFNHGCMHNTIVSGDALSLMRELSTGSVTLTLTDIPYDVVNRPSGGLRNLDKAGADVATFALAPFVQEVARVTSGSVYVWCSTEQVSELRQLLIAQGMTTRLGVWEKTNPSPMNGDKLWLSSLEVCVFGRRPKATFHAHCDSPVWRYPTVRSKRHPTEKSQRLFEHLIETSSNPGDLVLDPCLGSGTTAAAAKATGRRWLGCELDPTFAAIARDRVAAQATRIVTLPVERMKAAA